MWPSCKLAFSYALNSLPCCLCKRCIKLHFVLIAPHIVGQDNTCADALSHHCIVAEEWECNNGYFSLQLMVISTRRLFLPHFSQDREGLFIIILLRDAFLEVVKVPLLCFASYQPCHQNAGGNREELHGLQSY